MELGTGTELAAKHAGTDGLECPYGMGRVSKTLRRRVCACVGGGRTPRVVFTTPPNNMAGNTAN